MANLIHMRAVFKAKLVLDSDLENTPQLRLLQKEFLAFEKNKAQIQKHVESLDQVIDMTRDDESIQNYLHIRHAIRRGKTIDALHKAFLAHILEEFYPDIK